MPTTRAARAAAERFPLHVLRDYAVLADGQRGILVGPRGEFVWMCAPRWDSDAVFSDLIGGGGMYAVTPMEQPFIWGGSYEPGSLIWRSRWTTNSQTIECREALAFPGDPHTAVALRRISAVDGDTEVRAVLDPQAGFGQQGMTRLRCRDGVWTGRCGPLHLRWSGASEAITRRDGVLEAALTVRGGEHLDLVLEISDQPLDEEPVDGDRAWSATTEAWRRAVPQLTGTVADQDARHSYAVLRGLTSAGGGMVAGTTMCLPERTEAGHNEAGRAEAGRNYDYRYAWIRDQCHAGQAVAAYGPHTLLDDAVTFVADRLLADGPQLKPAYTIGGGPVPDERELDVPGYPGATAKTGNWADKQFQLDAFGEALQLFAAAAAHDHLDSKHWHAVEYTVAAIEQHAANPDAGIWELDDRRWTHSRLTCVAGLRAIADHAPAAQGTRWNALADAILSATTADCLHPTGRWRRAPDDDRVDASLLIPPLRGALPAEDPRTLATLDAVMAELVSDSYVYRYRIDERPLGEAEGAFLLCGFTTSLALHQQGRTAEANRMFERNRAACGPPGLLAEEYDATQHQLRGNLPQASVHALLLETALRLAEPWPQQASRRAAASAQPARTGLTRLIPRNRTNRPGRSDRAHRRTA